VGTVDSTPNTTLFIDVFASSAAQANGSGQAQRLLGSTAVLTDATGRARFAAVLSGAVTLPGEVISAMATRDIGGGQRGSSSELSATVAATQSLPGFTVSTTGLTTDEAGGTAQFGLALTTAPTADVTIRFASSDPGEGVPLVSSVVFTPFNWAVAQVVTAAGVPDAAVDGTQPFALLATATSADPRYQGIPGPSMGFNNLDRNRAAVLVSPAVVGPEFRINSTVAGEQGQGIRDGRGVAMDAAGNAVAVWASQNQDGSGWAVVWLRRPPVNAPRLPAQIPWLVAAAALAAVTLTRRRRVELASHDLIHTSIESFGQVWFHLI
jgi:hypothetical protein